LYFGIVFGKEGVMSERKIVQLFRRDMNKPDKWAIKGTVGGMTVIWGESGSYKTFLAISMAVAVAKGDDWFGKPVHQGPVLYIVGEGGIDLFQRRAVTAARAAGVSDFEIPDLPLWVIQGAVDLSKSSSLEPYVDEMEAIKPVLVIIDTLSRCMEGDENKQEVMQAFVSNVDAIKDRFHASVIVIHHANKQGTMRGSTVIMGAADVVIKTTKAKTSPGYKGLALKAEKLKDLDTDDFEPNQFQLKITAVRDDVTEKMLDEFGDMVTTLVLHDIDTENIADSKEQIVLKAIELIHLLKTGNDPEDKLIGYQEIEKEAGISPSRLKRALVRLKKQEKICSQMKGQYALGDDWPIKSPEQVVKYGLNHNTTPEELHKGDGFWAAREQREQEELEGPPAG